MADKKIQDLTQETTPAAADTIEIQKSGGGVSNYITFTDLALALPAATTSTAGVMTASDKTKLDGITAGGEVNPTIASTAEAEAGTDDANMMTPLKTKDSAAVVLQNLQTDNYTLVAGDKGKRIRMNKATAVNLTVPPNSSVAYTTDTWIVVENTGAGQVTIVEGSGVTVNIPPSRTLKLRGQNSMGVLIKNATDEWVLGGDLEAT